MIEFVLSMVAVSVAVGAVVVAVEAHQRIGGQEEENERRDARIVALGQQVQELRRDRLPPVHRLPVSWWDDLDHDIRQAS